MLYARPDISAYFSNPLFLNSGFNIEISNEALYSAKGPLRILAIYDLQTIEIAQVTFYDSKSVLTPKVEIRNGEGSQSDIFVERRVFENSIGLLDGQAQTQPDVIFKLLNFLVNLTYLLVSIFLIVAALIPALRNNFRNAKSMLLGAPLLTLIYTSDLPFSTLSFIIIFGFSFLLFSIWKRLGLNFHYGGLEKVTGS